MAALEGEEANSGDIFCVYRPYKESVSEEMSNDLNFHSITKLSGWLRLVSQHNCVV